MVSRWNVWSSPVLPEAMVCRISHTDTHVVHTWTTGDRRNPGWHQLTPLCKTLQSTIIRKIRDEY